MVHTLVPVGSGVLVESRLLDLCRCCPCYQADCMAGSSGLSVQLRTHTSSPRLSKTGIAVPERRRGRSVLAWRSRYGVVRLLTGINLQCLQLLLCCCSCPVISVCAARHATQS